MYSASDVEGLLLFFYFVPEVIFGINNAISGVVKIINSIQYQNADQLSTENLLFYELHPWIPMPAMLHWILSDFLLMCIGPMSVNTSLVLWTFWKIVFGILLLNCNFSP